MPRLTLKQRRDRDAAREAEKEAFGLDGDQEEDSEDELAEDSERCDGSDDEQGPQKQWQTLPLNCFKDLY